jgi:hypothetical protein
MSAPTQNEYLLLISGKDWYSGLSPAELQRAMDQFKVWFDRLSASGKLKGAQPLAREGAVVTKGGVVSDGPYAESKEAIGGYFLVQVETIEEAVAIAQGMPAIEYGAKVDVRPVAEECPLSIRARTELAERELAGV